MTPHRCPNTLQESQIYLKTKESKLDNQVEVGLASPPKPSTIANMADVPDFVRRLIEPLHGMYISKIGRAMVAQGFLINSPAHHDEFSANACHLTATGYNRLDIGIYHGRQ
jgi:hypothetical protein